MRRHVFRYTTVDVRPTDAFPLRTSTVRPYLALNLFKGPSFFSTYGLIDSGADDCIFPASFAGLLGLNFRSGRRYPFGGVGVANNEAYFFDLEMEIIGVAVHDLAVGFTTALDGRGHGLLGQNGFFERFSVRFDHIKKTFAVYS